MFVYRVIWDAPFKNWSNIGPRQTLRVNQTYLNSPVATFLLVADTFPVDFGFAVQVRRVSSQAVAVTQTQLVPALNMSLNPFVPDHFFLERCRLSFLCSYLKTY